MLKIMTFNLRFENDRDGDNSWQRRRDVVTGMISDYEPSILGTQEGTTGQLRNLCEDLGDYELLAPGRRWEEDCQYCSIFFRRDEIHPVCGGEFWLSLTPDVHKSTGWDSAFPRMISFGLFRKAGSERVFWAGVTHLDHVGVVARVRQAEIIRDYLVKQGGPRMLMGDFNDRPGSDAHKALTEPGTGLLDTWSVLHNPENESGMTYHKFTGIPQICRMDWILASAEFTVAEARVIHDHGPNGRYPSDHFPYLVHLDLV